MHFKSIFLITCWIVYMEKYKTQDQMYRPTAGRPIDVFSMLSCTVTSRLVYNSGYIQKLLQLSNSPEILYFGRLYLITIVLLNLDQFYIILTTKRQYFRFRKSAIMDKFVMFRRKVYTKDIQDIIV